MAVSLTQLTLRRLACGLAALVLAGCASVAANPEQAVRERATAHWKARMAKDAEAAYGYMPPSFRAVTSLEAYKKKYGGEINLTAAQVERVKCESEDKCVATSKVEAQVALRRASAGGVSTLYDEVWIRENGQWWLFPVQ
jgi:hypothetical protein